jgi:hypothetical protein
MADNMRKIGIPRSKGRVFGLFPDIRKCDTNGTNKEGIINLRVPTR